MANKEIDINSITKTIELKYYESIIYQLQKSNISYDWLNIHYDKLKNNISDNKISETSEVQTETIITQVDKQDSINTENHNKIFADDDLYKKAWSKLNSIHKILKIKEYVNNLKINSENDRIKLRDTLVDLVKNKVLTKKEKVKYDITNGIIISLVDLKCVNGNYSYPI